MALYPKCSVDDLEDVDINDEDNREINRPQILIFPRQSAKMGTARIRLTSSHGIQSDNGTLYGYDKEDSWNNLIFDRSNTEQGGENRLSFNLIKRDKVTLHMKVGQNHFIFIVC